MHTYAVFLSEESESAEKYNEIITIM